MEFGIFIQGYNPVFRRGDDPVEAEHRALMDELELVQAADKAGFKYVWVTEHHFLDEYSHLSANDVVCGYLAHATERIHIGSGIFNPLPQVNHPAKVAERVAMLDHLSNGRFEFGTGRGAGSLEILGFLPDMVDLTGTRAIWEDVIAEFPKMWLQDIYDGYEGKFWSLPPRKILPKPYKAPHPPMWYAAGNTSSYAMAARLGLGVLGFSIGSVEEMGPALEAYKREIEHADPVGAFVNDNVMVTAAAFVAEDTSQAKRSIFAARPTYLQSNVFRYHDTFPRPDWVPPWPELLPELDEDSLQVAIDAGSMVVGDPDQALATCQRWADAGADQLSFGLGMASRAESLEMIRLMGEHVIPKIDTDPVHRTTKMREGRGRQVTSRAARARRMDGKIVVVTGGGSGLGRACALRLAEEGAGGCVIADIDASAATRVAEEVTEATGCRADAFALDVSDEEACTSLTEHAVSEHGAIDVLVAAAGVSTETVERLGASAPTDSTMSIIDGPVDAWRRILDINLDGLMFTNRAVAACMVAAGTSGAIVNVTSMCSAWTTVGIAPYAVSKAGAWMLTKCLALELASYGIRVNAVGPGYIETPMTATTRADPAALAEVLRLTPMGRLGMPDEIANAVLFLASDESSFMTGEILYPDGGFNAPSR